MIAEDRLRTLIQTDAELSELFMRAFILRRVGLIASQSGDVILLGSSQSAGTLRLQQFLTRNSFPFVNLDVNTDQSVQALLERFHIKAEDMPVVLCRGEVVLKNPSNEEVAACLGMNQQIDDDRVRDSSSWARARRGWRPPCTPPPRDSTCWCSKRARPAARRGRVRK